MSYLHKNGSVSASHKVCLLLKEQILSGKYRLDEFLPPEEELLRSLGVSRTSLREGIKQMEALGWLRIERGNGTRVTRPDFTVLDSCLEFHARFELLRFEDVHAMRRLIEIEVIQQIASKDPADNADLIEKLQRTNQEIYEQREHPNGYIDADVAFHEHLINACPNPIYTYIMQGFRNYLSLSRQLSHSGPEAVIETVAAHQKIIDAIASADVEKATQFLREHFNTTEEQF